MKPPLPHRDEPGYTRENNLEAGFVTCKRPDWIQVVFDGDGQGNEDYSGRYTGRARFQPGSTVGDEVTLGLHDGSSELGWIRPYDTDIIEMSIAVRFSNPDHVGVQTGIYGSDSHYILATLSEDPSKALLQTPEASVSIPVSDYFEEDFIPVSFVWDRKEERAYVVINGLKSVDIDTSSVSESRALYPYFLHVAREAEGDASIDLRSISFRSFLFW